MTTGTVAATQQPAAVPSGVYPGPTPAAPVAGVIPNNVNLPNSASTTVFTTAALAVGTWVVTFIVLLDTTGDGFDFEPTVASGSATLSGVVAGSASITFQADQVTMTFVAVVTAAATLSLVATTTAAGGGATALAKSNQGSSYPGATGYVAQAA
jgi:hypothetical protein